MCLFEDLPTEDLRVEVDERVVQVLLNRHVAVCSHEEAVARRVSYTWLARNRSFSLWVRLYGPCYLLLFTVLAIELLRVGQQLRSDLFVIRLRSERGISRLWFM